MTAHAEEHRHDPQGPHAVAVQNGGTLGERRLHQFKERERDALAGQQFAEFGYELPERPRPLRVACAVGEKDEGSLDFSFCHCPIIFDAAASR